MKRIIAFIKPNMLDDVVFALHAIENFPGASISEVQDIGSAPRDDTPQADRTPFYGFPKCVRMEIVCPAAQTHQIIDTIRENAHTGLPDDGTIYVSPVDSALDVRTGGRDDGTGQESVRAE